MIPSKLPNCVCLQWLIAKGMLTVSEPIPSRKPRPAKTKMRNVERRLERRVVHERCPVLVTTTDGAMIANEANGIATDIGVRGIGLITSGSMMPNSEVTITLKSRYFVHEFRAIVIWCRELPTSGKIIKETPGLGWRMGLLFAPKSKDEEDLLRMVFEKL